MQGPSLSIALFWGSAYASSGILQGRQRVSVPKRNRGILPCRGWIRDRPDATRTYSDSAFATWFALKGTSNLECPFLNCPLSTVSLKAACSLSCRARTRTGERQLSTPTTQPQAMAAALANLVSDEAAESGVADGGQAVEENLQQALSRQSYVRSWMAGINSLVENVCCAIHSLLAYCRTLMSLRYVMSRTLSDLPRTFRDFTSRYVYALPPLLGDQQQQPWGLAADWDIGALLSIASMPSCIAWLVCLLWMRKTKEELEFVALRAPLEQTTKPPHEGRAHRPVRGSHRPLPTNIVQ
jgi:hypothetical protein